MALDFPSSPTTGQIFTAANGTSWQWNGTAWVAAGTATGLITGAPNKLINPFMEIDQANEGAAVTTPANSVDGWIAGVSGSTQRVTDAPPGYPNSIRMTITSSHTVAAGDVATFAYRIEAEDLADTRFGTASAQTLSLAFWVKSSVAGTYSAALRNAAATRSYVFPVVITTANTWQFISEVIPGDTAGSWVTSGNAQGMSLDIGLYVGSTYQSSTAHTWVAGNFVAPTGISNTIATTVGATFQLGPCGLWVAPAPQPLLRTSFQAELARCQRYYEKSYNAGVRPGTPAAVAASTGGWFGNGTAAQLNMGAPVAFKVAKRATPTTTIYDNAGTAGNMSWYSGSAWNNGLSAGAGGPGPSQSWMAVTQLTGGTVYYYNFDWVADARL